MTEGAFFAAATGISFFITFLGAFLVLRGRGLAPLSDKSDGRPIGGPALGLGIGCGLAFSLSVVRIDPFVLGGAALIFLLGLLDDALNLSPWRKLIGQGVAAGLATIGIGGVAAVSVLGLHVSLGIAGTLLTFVWIMILTNGVNLIDGLDGLAVGVTSPAALGLAIAAALAGNPSGVLLGAVLLGGLAGFYPWNRFRARLLLGDTGAELIGYLLAVTALQVFTFGERAFPILPAPFFFSFPIADTVFAVLRRAYHHRAVFQGDKEHIHHRLKRLIGEDKAVLLLSLLSALSTGMGIILWSRGL